MSHQDSPMPNPSFDVPIMIWHADTATLEFDGNQWNVVKLKHTLVYEEGTAVCIDCVGFYNDTTGIVETTLIGKFYADMFYIDSVGDTVRQKIDYLYTNYHYALNAGTLKMFLVPITYLCNTGTGKIRSYTPDFVKMIKV